MISIAPPGAVSGAYILGCVEALQKLSSSSSSSPTFIPTVTPLIGVIRESLFLHRPNEHRAVAALKLLRSDVDRQKDSPGFPEYVSFSIQGLVDIADALPP
jgi:hypothetical protein